MDILKGLLQLEQEQFLDDDEVEMVATLKKHGWVPKGNSEAEGETSQKGKRKRGNDEGKAPSKKKVTTVGCSQADFTETSAESRGKKKKVVASKKVVVSIRETLSKLAGPSGSTLQPLAGPSLLYPPAPSPAPSPLPESPHSVCRGPLQIGSKSAIPLPFNTPMRASL